MKIRVYASVEGTISREFEFPDTENEDELEEFFVLAEEKIREIPQADNLDIKPFDSEVVTDE